MPSLFSKWQCCVLSALMSLAAVASCLYAPALPILAEGVGRSMQALQFLTVANLLGHTLGPIFYALLANHWGRLSAIRTGLGLTIVGAGLCLLAGLAGSYHGLWLGCGLLTFGANVGLSLVLTMVKDRADVNQAQRLNALVLWSFAILPGAAVLVGGILLKHGAWWWIFVALIAYCLLLSYALRALPETMGQVPARLLSLHVLGRQGFWLPALIVACVTGCFYTFNAQIPRIALGLLHVDVIRFGLLSNLPSLGMLIGNIGAIYLAQRFPPQQTLKVGLAVAALVVLAMCIYSLWQIPSAVGLFVFTGLLNSGLQIIFPAAATLALATSDNHASAAGFLAMVNSGVAALLVAAGNTWSPTSYLSLPFSNGLIIAMAILLWWRYRRQCALPG